MNASLSLPPTSRLHGLSQTAIRGVVAAAQALELGRVDEADRHIIGLLALHPQHPEVLRLMAGAQGLRGQTQTAIATLQRAIALRPDDALYLNTLGSMQIDAFDYDGAIASLRRAVELDPKLVVAWYNLGLVLMRSMRVDESAVALRRAVELKPDEFTARVILGDMLRAEGRNAEAITEYRRVLAQRPDAGMAWWGLADMKTQRLGAADIAQMQNAMQSPNISEADAVTMGFALAKAFDDEGRYVESLHALEQANARARLRQRWNAAAHAANVDAVLDTFTPPRAGAEAALGAEVIFIASLPRSGSTLIEQVLASHSQVDGAGELSDLPLVLTEESQRRGQPFPQWVEAMQAEDWQRLGMRYLERTVHWRERRPRFTDKLPYNWFYIGAIRAMLPGARIIVGRRDPLETCFSCYRQHLANNEYTRTFADLGAFWRDFDRATKHWRTLHPTHVRENDYEHLVHEPEAAIRGLLAFCGLPFEPACLDFHKTEREVHTPSATQVREPLRRDTARASRYGALLDPLRAELGLPPFAASTQKD
ncbi:tetratricopeptide repeat-containing sulfotransferase family protein [Rudaea sp.]|uniref:tetratricopeptide repeat-containing sulfotransferase family protein n=1 Tax=Rudaea sp. TaxID=2136325 RepID=UPI002ED0F78C